MSVRYLTAGIGAETIKLKRSLALLAAVAVPLLPVAADLMGTMSRGLGSLPDDPAGINPWALYVRMAVKLWTIFAMPTVVAVASALLANLDHKPRAWKLLLALPFPRGGLFAAKWAALAAMTLLSTAVFAAGNVAAGLALHYLRPELGLTWPVPVADAVWRPLLGWALALFMMTIHLAIALRWPSFMTSLVIGLVASVGNLFVVGSYLSVYAGYIPWTLPAMTYGDWAPALAFSLAGTAVTYVLARRAFVGREVY